MTAQPSALERVIAYVEALSVTDGPCYEDEPYLSETYGRREAKREIADDLKRILGLS